ncbi:hypothetical protein PFICI_03387 [Pestalotiopsis fici W106-1]|uniref:RRM domain-containing protein n=1 Tax=Pestalotiopsis fici (strain W106-1 / CGMCC3.15140) TaxID=1229662 RepID=W3XIV2_PESFW|nr:uncharacterized protein PFICI_03387 [Pestalotiopsis fici W106-1]ETS85362.1 hypothetical protein PFICI_03387 [Pestalotiopsis fici W106-1]
MATAARTQNGVTTGSNATGEGGRKSKAQPTGQKLMIRHLPPLITEEEVQAILGEEWMIGNGKVDWAQFHAGKVSKSAFKEPRPSMYTLHVVKEEDVSVLKDFILRATWHDAKNSHTMLNFQVHAQNVSTRVPIAKHRVDPRQGTIDQDPEFQAFLHDLTQPKESQPKDIENGDQLTSSPEEPGKESKISHLVRYIQEKKAAKAKEAAAAKTARHSRQESQSNKTKTGDDSKKKSKEKSGADKPDKEKEKEKTKEPTPKILTKKAAATQASTAEASKQQTGQTAAAKPAEEAAPKSRRANIAQAAKILQRDLGLSPGSAHRRARQNAAKAEGASTTEPPTGTSTEKTVEETKEVKETKEPKESKEPEAPKSAPTGPKAQGGEGSRRSRNRGKGAASAANTTESAKGKASDGAAAKPTTGPVILLKKESSKKEDTASGAASSPTTPATTSTPTNSTSTSTAAPPTGPKAGAGKGNSGKSNNQPQQKKAAAQPTSGAVRAFVKHANPSQGITEPLLKQAMEAFGSVTFVEIDKRKGFAYVDFGDAESLRKAISASPISIAQGTVQVLERKDKKPAAPTNAATSTPAAQPSASAEKAAADSQTPTPATASASTDRPKRGNRGRGRRGGAGAASANATSAANTTTSNDTAPVANPPATG